MCLLRISLSLLFATGCAARRDSAGVNLRRSTRLPQTVGESPAQQLWRQRFEGSLDVALHRNLQMISNMLKHSTMTTNRVVDMQRSGLTLAKQAKVIQTKLAASTGPVDAALRRAGHFGHHVSLLREELQANRVSAENNYTMIQHKVRDATGVIETTIKHQKAHQKASAEMETEFNSLVREMETGQAAFERQWDAASQTTPLPLQPSRPAPLPPPGPPPPQETQPRGQAPVAPVAPVVPVAPAAPVAPQAPLATHQAEKPSAYDSLVDEMEQQQKELEAQMRKFDASLSK